MILFSGSDSLSENFADFETWVTNLLYTKTSRRATPSDPEESPRPHRTYVPEIRPGRLIASVAEGRWWRDFCRSTWLGFSALGKAGNR